MKRCAFALAVVVFTTAAAHAARQRAVYELELAAAKSNLESGDSSLVVQADSTKRGVRESRVEHDSLIFLWKPTKTWVEYELRNNSAGTVRILWDSANAIDPEGRRLRLAPYEKGGQIDWEYSIPPRKIAARAEAHGDLVVLARAETGALVVRDMLPVRSEDHPFANFDTLVQEQVGKIFRLVMAIERNQTIRRYTFTFTVKNAQIRSL